MKDFRKNWKTLAANKQIQGFHYIQRAALIAIASKRNVPKEDIFHILLDRYFTPITNKNKLKNGMEKYSTIKKMAFDAQWATEIIGIHATEFFDNGEELKAYQEMIKKIYFDKIDRKYVYYFTIQDILSPEQQGVQAGHALFALGSRLGKEANAHETYFQWIGVRDSGTLYSIAKKYEHLDPVKFYEPDVGHKMTSIALPPIPWYKRGDLTEYPLLTHQV